MVLAPVVRVKGAELGEVELECGIEYMPAYRLSHFIPGLFTTLWTVAHQAPLPMGLSRQEYWSGFPCPPSGDLPDPRNKPKSLRSHALAGGFFNTTTTWEARSRMFWS